MVFYICRFSDNWSIYDTATNKSRPLDTEEMELLKKLFGGLLNDTGKILSAVKVEAISPNKLLALTMKTANP
ncbi:MAG: hypothetical protein ABI581_08185 [Sediminibacterium sp.]